MDYKYYLKFIFKLKKSEIVTQRFKSVHEITYANFAKEAFDLIIFDIDDTLTHHLGALSSDVYELLQRLQKKGFSIGIYSNCSESRLQELYSIFKDFGVYIVDQAHKPNPTKYLEIIKHYRTSPSKTIMVGDKVGTDLYGAFLANIKSRVLVEPFSNIFGGKKTSIFQRFVRNLEKKVSF